MKKKKVLAVASRGGHWIQLKRLTPVLTEHNVVWVTTNIQNQTNKNTENTFYVRDANMTDKIGLIVLAIQVLICVIKYRPEVVITTGAAPGYFALMFGKMSRARTIWLDSIANTEEMSLAGNKVKKWADHWLTQWPEIATTKGPHYIGSVM